MFIKRNNKRKDIFKEYYYLQYKVFDIDKFVANYNFTHFIVNDNDRLYSYLVNNSKNINCYIWKRVTRKINTTKKLNIIYLKE